MAVLLINSSLSPDVVKVDLFGAQAYDRQLGYYRGLIAVNTIPGWSAPRQFSNLPEGLADYCSRAAIEHMAVPRITLVPKRGGDHGAAALKLFGNELLDWFGRYLAGRARAAREIPDAHMGRIVATLAEDLPWFKQPKYLLDKQ